MGIETIISSVDQKEVKRVLRIVLVCLIALAASFFLVFYGIFSAETYLGTLLCIALAGYILLPVTFRCCPYIQQYMVFQSHVDASGVDFDNPEGIEGVRNVKLASPQGISLGLWHILPADISETSLGQTEDFWETSVRSGNHNGVIVYYHGVTGTRGKPHRLELYKVLQNHGHHIITCDYRGFADSTKVKRITESGIVTDAINVYRWVKNDLLKGHAEIPIFVWGHSLGTGISTHLVRKLREEANMVPDGLVLESPFDNFGEELRHHRKLKIWSRLPFFDYLFVQPLHRNDIIFQNDGHIAKIHVPIMIMHAKDDNVIPSLLGKRLYEIGKQRRPAEACPLYFVHMNAGRHNEIYRDNAHSFREVVESFIKGCISKNHGWHKSQEWTSHECLELHSSH